MFSRHFFSVIKISFFIFVISACAGTSSQQSETIKPKPMENTNTEPKKIKVLDTFTIELKSRGSLGLQLAFRTDKDGIVAVTRLPADSNSQERISPGDPLKVIFEIKALKPGTVNITFFETQPWNKDFQEIIKKEIEVEVVE